MKTVYAPGTSQDLFAQLQSVAADNPGVVMLLALLASVAFATWATKHLF